MPYYFQGEFSFIEVTLNCIAFHNKHSVLYMGTKDKRGWSGSTQVQTIDTVNIVSMEIGELLLINWRGAAPERGMKAFRVVSVPISFKLEA